MGEILMVIFSLVLAFVVIAAGAGKFRKAPQVLVSLRHIGVHPRFVTLLGALEVIGGVVLLVGLASAELGEIAATVLAVYFAAYIAAHRRVGDVPARYRPLMAIFVLSIGTAILQYVR